MNRIQIYNTLNAIAPTFSIGHHKGICKSSFVVIKYETQITSLSNSQGGWQYLNVFCYVPLGDILLLDKLVGDVVRVLRDKLEYTGVIAPEVLEEDIKAYSRKVSFRIPKGGI